MDLEQQICEARQNDDAAAADSEGFLLLAFDKSSRQDLALWWRPKSAGYTTRVEQAGRYTEAEARDIETKSRGDVHAVPIALALSLQKSVVDIGDYRDALRGVEAVERH